MGWPSLERRPSGPATRWALRQRPRTDFKRWEDRDRERGKAGNEQAEAQGPAILGGSRVATS